MKSRTGSDSMSGQILTVSPFKFQYFPAEKSASRLIDDQFDDSVSAVRQPFGAQILRVFRRRRNFRISLQSQQILL